MNGVEVVGSVPLAPAVGFGVGALISLGASLVLVTRLEKVAERIGLSEAILGLAAALGANAPEVTSSITALLRGERDIGIGVILGSNVFNLAALLGLGALISRRIRLHRRVVVLTGSAAVWLALVSMGTVASAVPAAVGLVLALIVFVPYVLISGAAPVTLQRLPIPNRVSGWLVGAISEEEAELNEAIHPETGGWPDVGLAAAALSVVVAASVSMEGSASSLGVSLGMSKIVVGGVVLAGVTSLPNAVAAVYLALHGRGSAVLSEALNSNNLNVVLGLLIPVTILGVGSAGAPGLVTAGWYTGLTLVALAIAFARRGIGLVGGGVIILGYLGFVVVAARL